MKSILHALTVLLAVVALPVFGDELPNKFVDTGGNLRLAPKPVAPIGKSSKITPRVSTAADSVNITPPYNQSPGAAQEPVSSQQRMMPPEAGLPNNTPVINTQPTNSPLPANYVVPGFSRDAASDAAKLNQPVPQSMQAVPVAPVSATPPANNLNPAIVNQKPASTY